MRPRNRALGLSDIRVDVSDKKDGTYTCVYTPEFEGEYELSVTVDAEEVKRGVPGSIEVLAVASGEHSRAEGEGLKRAFLGRPNMFVVYARDEDGRPLLGKDIMVVCSFRS